MNAPAAIAERAPAKLNLTLAILGRREDGYHLLESLVAFADELADELAFTPDAPLSLRIDGPTAFAAGAPEANLVLKAARSLAERRDGLKLGAFALRKRIPVAAGLGGGSADAAAALRILARANGLSIEDPSVAAAARATGADVAVCLAASARMMRGVGDEIGEAMTPPPFRAILVHPGPPCPTAQVFAALDHAAGETRAASRREPPRDAGPLMRWIVEGGNDLEPAAIRLVPVIGDALAELRSLAGCAVARMSGSGATCFGLFEKDEDVRRASRHLQRARPQWLTKVTSLR